MVLLTHNATHGEKTFFNARGEMLKFSSLFARAPYNKSCSLNSAHSARWKKAKKKQAFCAGSKTQDRLNSVDSAFFLT